MGFAASRVHGITAAMKHWLKLVLEVGPLLVFFVGNAKFGIVPGTAAFVVATLIALVASWTIARKVPTLPLVSALFVVVFGGLTVWLENDMFIKLKPTLVNLLFAGVLFFGLATGRDFLKMVFETAFHLTAEGWRKLTWRWAFFFLLLAALNEIVWRSTSTDVWVDFKVFGILPLTLVFSLAQMPLLMKYQVPAEAPPESEASADEPW